MSKGILIIGESGSGKTTSLRNLPPQESYYINADKKSLSWKGWRNDWNKENKNYKETSNVEEIKALLLGISEKATQIKYVVIDTLNAIMIDDEMQRMAEKGFDKWQDLAVAIYDIVSFSNTLRDDLFVICTGHAQSERDDSGYVFTRMKTSGKKLDKIVVESKFTTVLLTKKVNGRHVYEVHANNSTAKTPLDAFKEDEIEADIMKVIEVLKEY